MFIMINNMITMVIMITTMMTMVIMITIPSPTWSSWPDEEQSAAHKSRSIVLLFSFRFQIQSKEDFVNVTNVFLSSFFLTLLGPGGGTTRQVISKKNWNPNPNQTQNT